MPVDRDRYRSLAGSFPTGVTIITAPSTTRTLAAMREAKGFVINFLKTGAEEVSTVFASKSDGKFAGVPRRTYAGWPEERPAPQVG